MRTRRGSFNGADNRLNRVTTPVGVGGRLQAVFRPGARQWGVELPRRREPEGALDAGAGRIRPPLLGELGVAFLLLVVYDHVRRLDHVRRVAAMRHGLRLLDLERVAHLSVESSVNRWLMDHDVVRLVSVDYYQFLHSGVALAMLAACYAWKPERYRAARNSLVLVNVAGFVVYVLYPVAPPRLLPGAGFVDAVAKAGFGSGHGPIPTDQFGAMPSLHMAWAIWVVLIGFALTKNLWVRALLVVHPIATALVVVSTANHYLADAVAGSVLGAIAVVAVSQWRPARRSAPVRCRPRGEGAADAA
jgi:membrane-associated phospholipid phosphatase